MDEAKNYKLAIFLIKEKYQSYDEVIKNYYSTSRYPVDGNIAKDGLVVVGESRETIPNWKNLLQEGVKKQLPDVVNSSSRAVLLLRINKRIFAIPFGYGKHMLKDETLDLEFGLRTALNIVNADKLISMDKANIGDMSVLTKTQTSIKGNTEVFNVDTIKDLLRSVTGEPNKVLPEEYGSIITGNDGVYINPKINFRNIPKILSKLEEDYNKEDYKARFDWIENIKLEKNPEIIEKLKECLLSDLEQNKNENIHLAPPFFMFWEDFEYYSFTKKGNEYQELDMLSFYEHRDLTNLDWEKLIRFRIYVKYTHSDTAIPYPLWKFINYEVKYGNVQYVFSLGNWYQVSIDYFEKIKAYCNDIPESQSTFINYNNKEREDNYNVRLSASNKNYLLFDKDNISSPMKRSPIELCDILNYDEKEFIHIKKRSSSATMSHLFAQGKISAECIMRDEEFRKKVRSKLSKKFKKNIDFVPIKFNKFSPSNYRITFALMDKENRTFVDSLPFFSLVNFRITAESLQMNGFKVQTKKILINQ